MARDDAVDDYLACETVAFLKVDCADEGLESVAFYGFEYALRFAVVLYQLRQPDVVGEAVEAFAADNLCAQLGEVALALARVAAEQHFGHHRGEERVAEVLEPLVVYAAALWRKFRFRLVDESDLVKMNAARGEPQFTLEEIVKFLVFSPVAKTTPHLNIS